MSDWAALANACGFGYLRNSDFVTMLTRTSVDCAESMVAMSNSNGLVKSSEHFAFGYIRLSRETMSAARSCFFVAIGIESNHEHDRARNPNRSRAARHRNLVPRMAAGSGLADVDEQPRPGSRRASRPAHCVWRHGKGGAQLGVLRRNRRHAEAIEKRRDAAGPVGKAGRRFQDARERSARADRKRESRSQVG